MPWWAWYILGVATIPYLKGFRVSWSHWMDRFENEHPMSHSFDYRWTDGYLVAFAAALLWPVDRLLRWINSGKQNTTADDSPFL